MKLSTAILMEKNSKTIFVDTSALIALYVKNDQYHKKAADFWKRAKDQGLKFATSNFVFDEVVTWMLYKGGKKLAVDLGEYILTNPDILPVKPVLPEDEKEGWRFFKELSAKASYTDCTSFSLMKRFDMKQAFTFDGHFTYSGFNVLP